MDAIGQKDWRAVVIEVAEQRAEGLDRRCRSDLGAGNMIAAEILMVTSDLRFTVSVGLVSSL